MVYNNTLRIVKSLQKKTNFKYNLKEIEVWISNLSCQMDHRRRFFIADSFFLIENPAGPSFNQ